MGEFWFGFFVALGIVGVLFIGIVIGFILRD